MIHTTYIHTYCKRMKCYLNNKHEEWIKKEWREMKLRFSCRPLLKLGIVILQCHVWRQKQRQRRRFFVFFLFTRPTAKLQKAYERKKTHQRMSRTISTPYPNRIRLEIKIELNIRQSLRKLSSINVLDSLDGTLPTRPHTHTYWNTHARESGKFSQQRDFSRSLAFSSGIQDGVCALTKHIKETGLKQASRFLYFVLVDNADT